MFINPVRMQQSPDGLEPDSQPIEENQARSAILFGPPGTSKTTLVRSVADVVRWKYIELHASHFVKQGLAQVQKTADDIFERLWELDHAVILFDEIDELVRERDMEKDAFGRFLTTSMLPKLAELWEARKILYFVATNHINYFDSAIIRSHRFDALILVSPPSFEAKLQRLKDLLRVEYKLSRLRFQIVETEIQKELDSLRHTLQSSHDKMDQALLTHWKDLALDNNYTLAKFALLRYDEVDELAYRVATTLRKRTKATRTISNDTLREALRSVSDSQWRKNKSYSDYLRDIESERKDYQMVNVWELSGKNIPEAEEIVARNEKHWLVKPGESLSDVFIKGFKPRPTSPGHVRLQAIT